MGALWTFIMNTPSWIVGPSIALNAVQPHAFYFSPAPQYFADVGDPLPEKRGLPINQLETWNSKLETRL